MKLFFDANILMDIAYEERPLSKESSKLYSCLIQNISTYEIYTSCDLITTLYYVLRKQMGNVKVLQQIKLINHIIKVVEFGNNEVDEAIFLMEHNEKFSDLEDTIQFVMAKKERCDYIVSNDKGFFSHDIPVLTSAEALKEICQL
jgi:predicted nucleic acid-binding protein